MFTFNDDESSVISNDQLLNYNNNNSNNINTANINAKSTEKKVRVTQYLPTLFHYKTILYYKSAPLS